MHCFYVERENIADGRIQITGADVNHIKNVLRMHCKDPVILCDGCGVFYSCRLADIEKDTIYAEIEEKMPATTELPVKITLFQGIPKKDKLEWIVQKAVELGVSEIVPVASRFCVAKIEDEKKEKKKLERLKAISEAAAKQSGRGKIPEVRPVLSFKEAVGEASALEYSIIPYELENGMGKSEEAMEQASKAASVGIFIGPEGGFAPQEIELAREAGIIPVSLGKRILRTETAGLTALSVLMFKIENRKR